MAKLALLALAFLALPLAAGAAPEANSSVAAKQFAIAAADCAAARVTPADPQWGSCVNWYLQTNYKYQLMPFAGHRLAMVRVRSQSGAVRLVLPVALPATVTAWKMPVRYTATIYQDGEGWCADLAGFSYARACAGRPDMAYAGFLEHLNKEPQRWPHMGGEHIQPY